MTEPAAPSSRAMLLVAAVTATLISRFVPHGRSLLFPFTLLATWVHEMGHGLAALFVGGRIDRLEIFADASGLAHTSHGPGLPAALVALGGLVAPPLVGALILALARGPHRARMVLASLALGLLVSTLIYVRNTAGLVVAPLLGLALVAVLRLGGGREQMFVAQFIALHLALDTLGRGLSYLFTDAVMVDGERHLSDIGAVAAGLGGPRVLWSIAVAAGSITLVLLGLFAAFRRPGGKRIPGREQEPGASGS